MRLRTTRTRIGTGLLRGGGQVAMSVAATLIATGLFTLWRPADPPARPAPELTTGGKFGARVAGAEPPASEPGRPRLSIVDWAITPVGPTRLVSDVAWHDAGAGWGAAPKTMEPRLAQKPRRRPATASAAAAVPVPPSGSENNVSMAALPLAEPRRGLLASAANAAASVASGTRTGIEAANSGVLHLGLSVVDRIAGLVR